MHAGGGRFPVGRSIGAGREQSSRRLCHSCWRSHREFVHVPLSAPVSPSKKVRTVATLVKKCTYPLAKK
jgi:hypothetical protein